jgi:hypothetical protein
VFTFRVEDGNCSILFEDTGSFYFDEEDLKAWRTAASVILAWQQHVAFRFEHLQSLTDYARLGDLMCHRWGTRSYPVLGESAESESESESESDDKSESEQTEVWREVEDEPGYPWLAD